MHSIGNMERPIERLAFARLRGYLRCFGLSWGSASAFANDSILIVCFVLVFKKFSALARLAFTTSLVWTYLTRLYQVQNCQKEDALDSFRNFMGVFSF